MEVVAVVEETRSELLVDRPNRTKLQAFFSVITSTIQTLASAQPAYQALKTALLPFGVILP
jgi:hypothetical protein